MQFITKCTSERSVEMGSHLPKLS